MAARLLAALFAVLLAGCGEERAVALKAGEPAPAFARELFAGGRVNFPADYRGRVVMLRFWADWCPYCRKEMAEIDPLWRRLEGRGLAVLAVNVAQDRDTVARFLAPLGIGYGVALDPEGSVARAYGVTSLPVTWLIGRDGRLRGKILGEASAEVFEARALALLGEGGG